MDAANTPDVDPLQQLLLAQLAGDPVQAGPSMEDLLAQRPEDPMTTAVLEALRRRREREALPADRESASEATDLDAGEPETPEGVGSDPGVADVLRRLYDEVTVLRARTEALADALGACAKCWGEPTTWCPTCRARGSSGGRVPVESAFVKYVAPAVERRRAYLASRTPVPGTPTSLNEVPTGEPVSTT
jgi:hypothetical protein